MVAAMSPAPSAARQVLINNTIGALISAGIWSLLDLFYMLAAHDEQAAKLNWKEPASNALTNNNSTTFTVDRGFTGNGTDMSLSASYTNALYTQNNGHVAGFSFTNGTTTARDVSVATVTSAARGAVRVRNVGSAAGAVGTFAVTGSTTADNVPRLLAANRDNDPNNQVLYSNGVFDRTGAVASSSFTISTVHILDGVDGSLFSDRQIAFGSVGASLTAAQHTSLNTIVRAYLSGVGAI